jgi:hypothetical protein
MQVSAQRTLNITIDHFVMAVTAAEAGPAYHLPSDGWRYRMVRLS